LAAQIIGASDKAVLNRIIAYKESLKTKVEEGAEKVRNGH
ncbi:MAG TPA: 5-(carboxyamino)imidazole ribonucleotide mutase, partial [Aequorivita sp.]|nr:5-(carboxyamino)imidazole ribonucleotide mutase [Aequorivita sp.]